MQRNVHGRQYANIRISMLKEFNPSEGREYTGHITIIITIIWNAQDYVAFYKRRSGCVNLLKP